jgi:alginate O-acetyltransferase complex protein AlgJ
MSNIATIFKWTEPAVGVHLWALDFPQRDVAPKMTERGLYLQGWVLAKAGVTLGGIVIRSGEGQGESMRTLPFNNGRPDVIQRVLGVPALGHPQLRCGFTAWLTDVPQDFTLGVAVDGTTSWLCRVQLHGSVAMAEVPEPQVIEGSDGWLFLDNDTNRSVDQYTGRLKLDQAGLGRWQAYLDGVRDLAAATGARHAVLFAASKEQVLPEYYPHQKGVLTVHEQVLSLCRAEHHVVDTAALLAGQADKEACFIKTDTHWTDRGAMLAALAVLECLGLDADTARRHWSGDVYYTLPFAGDLGVKLRPAMSAPAEFLQAPPVASDAAFDNHLPNIGRVLVFENAAATWPHSLLLFGASSSYPMLKYLKRVFGRIVFVHSAGNVDVDTVARERADYVVLQTTARFMIEPPGTSFRLADAVMTKTISADENARARAAAAAARAAVDPKNLPYCRMLEPQ